MDLIIEMILILIASVFAHLAFYIWINKKPRTIRARHVLITGGSSGIGFCVAKECVKLGAHVTIVDGNSENLEAALAKLTTQKINNNQMIQYRSVNLSKNYQDIENVFSALETDVAPIYMLVNCAGDAVYGRIDTMTPEDADSLMNENYRAVYYPTRYILTKFKHNGDGIITITGSQSSSMGTYGYGAYTAAKFALRGLAEVIAMEVANTNITVTLALSNTDKFGLENENQSTPEDMNVARKIVSDSINGKFISILGLRNWLLTIICSGMSPWGNSLFAVSRSIFFCSFNFGTRCYFKHIAKSTSIPSGKCDSKTTEANVEVSGVELNSTSTDKMNQTKANLLPTSLTTSTPVTVTIATTTSILNTSPNTVNSKSIHPSDEQNNNVTIETAKPDELNSTLEIASSALLSGTKPSLNMSTTLPISTVSTSSTPSESAPRLEGFSFSTLATQATDTPTKLEETKPATTGFSFGTIEGSNIFTLAANTLSKDKPEPFSFSAVPKSTVATKSSREYKTKFPTTAAIRNVIAKVSSAAPPVYSFGPLTSSGPIGAAVKSSSSTFKFTLGGDANDDKAASVSSPPLTRDLSSVSDASSSPFSAINVSNSNDKENFATTVAAFIGNKAQLTGMFNAKTAEITGTVLSPSPAVGPIKSSAFSFTPKSKEFGGQTETNSFAFKAPNSSEACQIFGMGKSVNQKATAKSFNFDGAATASAKTPFSFNGPTSATPQGVTNVFKFGVAAEQPPPANVHETEPIKWNQFE